MRRFCSIELVRMARPLNREDAATALGLPRRKYGYADIVGSLTLSGNDELFAARLREVARDLSGALDRVDYRARRAALASFEEVPWEEWLGICERSSALPGYAGGRNRFAGVWVWSEVTCGDFRLAPGLLGRGAIQRDGYRSFCRKCLPRVRDELRAYAAALTSPAGSS